MSSRNHNAAVGLAIVVIVAVLFGAVWFLQDILQFVRRLDQALVAVLMVALVIGLYVGLSIRRAGDRQGLQQWRVEHKAQCYQQWLAAWAAVCALVPDAGESYQVALRELQAASQSVALRGSASVVKQVTGVLDAFGRDAGAKRGAIEPVLRAMRTDLGEHGIGLRPGELGKLGFERSSLPAGGK